MSFRATKTREACAERTAAEVAQMRAPRPLAFREELRIKGMLDRCSTCQACPAVIRALTIMLPQPEAASAEIVKLAG